MEVSHVTTSWHPCDRPIWHQEISKMTLMTFTWCVQWERSDLGKNWKLLYAFDKRLWFFSLVFSVKIFLSSDWKGLIWNILKWLEWTRNCRYYDVGYRTCDPYWSFQNASELCRIIKSMWSLHNGDPGIKLRTIIFASWW